MSNNKSVSKLALFGGKPIRRTLFPAYNPIGRVEMNAVQAVMRSGNLSQFLGSWHPDFFGGPRVRHFEKNWAGFFKSRYAVSLNSCTSGLYAAVGACGIGPGDEVIVSPYTMTASAIAPFIYGAVPIFADIDPDIFCLDPADVERKITSRTKAIIVVHLFGHPADMTRIMKIAQKHHLKVIEDCAQAPGTTYKGKFVGTIGHVGVFSLNYHKHIHTGEGGMAVTDDADLAEKLQLIRNHGEAVVEGKKTRDLTNTYGFNFRMGEIEAAIGIEQLKKLNRLLRERILNAHFLAREIGKLPGITSPKISPRVKHVYYLQAFKFNERIVGIPRNLFVNAVKAELPSARLRETVPLLNFGYAKPLYLQPIYQRRLGRCSFNCSHYTGRVSYRKGLCPVAERMHFYELFTHEFMRPGMSHKDLLDVIAAYEKVYEHAGALKRYRQRAIKHGR